VTADEIWEALDRAGLVPGTHWVAAPHDWRVALLEIEEEIEKNIAEAVAEAT
jgi:hypothetical protein